MDWTLNEIVSELRQIPGYVRFSVLILGAGDYIQINVHRRQPWGQLQASGVEMQQIINELQELGRSPLPSRE